MKGRSAPSALSNSQFPNNFLVFVQSMVAFRNFHASNKHFLTGAVHLRSNVNLHLSEGATLRFIPDLHRYLPAVCTSIGAKFGLRLIASSLC
jgi:hypothetical protein